MHVGDAALPLEDPSALQLDPLGGEVFEETAPLADEHRDDVELDLRVRLPWTSSERLIVGQRAPPLRENRHRGPRYPSDTDETRRFAAVADRTSRPGQPGYRADWSLRRAR